MHLEAEVELEPLPHLLGAKTVAVRGLEIMRGNLVCFVFAFFGALVGFSPH